MAWAEQGVGQPPGVPEDRTESTWQFRTKASAHRTSYGVMRVPRALSCAECGKVLEMAASLPSQAGLLEAPVAGARRSSVRWIQPSTDSRWLFERIEAIVLISQADLGFDIDSLTEPLQLASYCAGGLFDWHIDLAPDPVLERKLSLTLQLSPEDSYQGGDLEFFPFGPVPRSRAQGTALVFPSFVPHRVQEVTSGVRHALVAWAGGSPLR